MRTILFKLTFICLSLAGVAFSQSLISQISWRGASNGIVVGLVIVFATGLGILISIYLDSQRKRSKIKSELSMKLFNEGCQRCRLSATESKILSAVSAYARDTSVEAHHIFNTLPLYERCVNDYVNSCLSSPHGIDQNDIDEILGIVRKKVGYNTLSSEQALMSTRNLSIGQRVDIIPGGQNAQAKGATVTHVGEFYFTARLLERPSIGDEEFITRGSDAVVSLLRHGDAAYRFTVKTKEVTSGGAMVSFFHSLKFTRSQNRRYLRMDVGLQLKYRILERASIGGSKPPSQMFQVRGIDIGGGGLSFMAGEPLIVGDIISLTILMPGHTLGGIKSKILRVIPADGQADAQYKHLVQFLAIEPQQREYIVKFIFEKQREMLQMR